MVPDDLYRLVFIEDAQVSPDASAVAYVRRWPDDALDAYRSEIWTVALGGGDPVRYTSGGREDSQPRWSPDGAWLAFLSNRDAEKKQLWMLPTGGGEARRLTSLAEGVQSYAWSPDSRRLVLVARVPAREGGGDERPATRIITSLKYKSNGDGFVYDRRSHIHIFSLESGQTVQITEGDCDDLDAAWSPDGREIAFSSARHPGSEFDTVTDIYAVSADGGPPLCLTAGRGTAVAPAFSPDGREVAFLGHAGPHPGGSRNLILSVVGAGGGEVRELTHSLDRTAIGELRPVWSPDGQAIAIGVLDRGAVGLSAIGASDGTCHLIAGGRRQLTSWSFSQDWTRVAFTASDPSHPPEAFACDLKSWNSPATDERRLTSENSALLAEVEPSVPESFTFQAAGGLEVEGWVMIPRSPSSPLPTLLNIHGGPHAFYGWGFFDEFQMQAGAGFAVIYLNPRGSQGYGEEFARACCGDWGGGDFEDLMQGLDEALRRFTVLDADRLGVLGGSYGGFMTSWIIGHSARFRAAATERAVNAPVSLFGTSDIGFWFEQFEIGDNPLSDRDTYWQQSPLAYATEVTTPTMILHGENDLRCPIEQAEQYYVALKLQRRADVVFVRFPEENHELTRSGKPRRRVERFQILLDWFEHYLRPGEERPARVPELGDAIRAAKRERAAQS